MHFYSALAFGLALFSAASAKALDARFYSENFASIQVDRINNYKSDHADSLTDEQETLLDKCLDIIETQDHSQLADIRVSIEAAFGPVEASFILNGITGTSTNEAVTKRNLLRRARDCTCSTDDNYCGESEYCKYNHRGCKFNNGCGTFWLEQCDGMCVKK